MKKTSETEQFNEKHVYEHIEDIGYLLGYDPVLVAEALYCYNLLSRESLKLFDDYLENNSILDIESVLEEDL